MEYIIHRELSENTPVFDELYWRMSSNMISGFMKKYRESLAGMSEPIMLSQMEKKMDLRGLMQYAKDKGVKVSQLSESERLQHSHVTSRATL
jgi:hypothetical protein